MRVAFATCKRFPNIDVDDAPAAESLQRLGATVKPAIWDDAAIRWERFDACIIRSTWDFHLQHEKFLGWVDDTRRRTLVLNSPRLIGWNCDKSYLLELQQIGVPMVPTALRAKHDTQSIRSIVDAHEWSRFVVKPSVSASSW
ncbi:MAG: hypothetical protein M3N13_06415, partial [Candidatus Eremiobacteraeota bacterium]|nr:hypothetical protein [Candidatus Eremiobacteraeota bacterium]